MRVRLTVVLMRGVMVRGGACAAVGSEEWGALTEETNDFVQEDNCETCDEPENKHLHSWRIIVRAPVFLLSLMERERNL